MKETIIPVAGNARVLEDRTIVAARKALPKGTKNRSTVKLLLSATPLELATYIAEKDFCVFSEEARSLFDKTSFDVGRGELSIRCHKGLSLETQGNKSGDIPELGWEVKEWNGVKRIKPGATAQQLLVFVLMSVYHKHADFFDSQFVYNGNQTTYKRQACVGISKGFLECLPAHISDELRESLRASVTIQHDNMALVWKEGFIVVPRADYDSAFTFTSVSQQIPRYAVNRSYLEDRVRQLIFIEQLMNDVSLVPSSWDEEPQTGILEEGPTPIFGQSSEEARAETLPCSR